MYVFAFFFLLFYFCIFFCCCNQFDRDYFKICRQRDYFIKEKIGDNAHYLRHPELLSLHDLVLVLTSDLLEKLIETTDILGKHIMIECDMCRLRGHLCEICHENQVIYSFQLESVHQCAVCKGYFHRKCWKNVNQQCPRCQRRMNWNTASRNRARSQF